MLMESNKSKMNNPDINKLIDIEVNGLKFTKKFSSPTAEECYIFLTKYIDTVSGGAAGKAIY